MKKIFGNHTILVFVAVVLLATGASWFFRSTPQCNLLLITLDTTRADHIGCFGNPTAVTPVIDQIARRGVLFKNAYAICPVTLPSHATMFTGLYPREHGIHHNGIGKLDAQIPTLAESLQSQGYDTGGFIGAFVLNRKFGLNRGFQEYDDATGGEIANGQFHRRRSGQFVVDAALEWLKKRTSRPFFCWVHLFDPHAPYRPREELFGSQFTDRPYDAGISVCDQQIGRIVNYLDTLPKNKPTIIVIVGDHGEGLGEHQEREHGHMLYNSTLRVPLIVAHPTECKPGISVTQTVSLVDLAPTLHQWLGGKWVGKFSGRSLGPLLKGDPLPARPCFAETDIPFLEHGWAPQRCLITEDWKYIRSPKPELYDLRQDPEELRNLAEDVPETTSQMDALMSELEEGQHDHRAQKAALSSSERRSLASLGYVGNVDAQDELEKKRNDGSLPDIKYRLKYHEAVEDASQLLDINRPDEAAKILHEVLADVPDYFPARIFLGEALAKSGKLDEAREIYQKLAESDSGRSEVHARLASVLGLLGKRDEALVELQRAVDLAGNSAEQRVALGIVALELNQQDKAVELFQSAIRIDPIMANFEMGRFFAVSGDQEGALSCYKTTLEHDPNWIPLYSEVVALLGRQRRFTEALGYARKAVMVNPNDADGHYNLGVVYAQLGKFEEALSELFEALKLNPQHPKAPRELKRVQAEIQTSKPKAANR